MSDVDVKNINEYYAKLLDKDPQEATIDELLDCLQPENAVERIAYRKSLTQSSKRDFIRLTRGSKGQASMDKVHIQNES